jgi:hypothetical protein
VTDYCDPSDVYAHGFPRGSVPNPGRLVEDVSASADTLTLDQHGFALNDPVSFRVEAGGSLPAPLVAGTEYFAIPEGDDVFSVASVADGAAVNLTTGGSNFIAIAPLPMGAAIAWSSRMIEDMLPAHVVPLDADAIPEIVRMTCAELTAGKLAARAGSQSKSLTEIVDAAGKRLARWGKGVPIRGAVVPPSASLAASATLPFRDRRGWNRFGGP